MPVTVKIQDKSRKRVVAPNAPPPAELGDYAVPTERSEGLKSFLVWFFIMLSVCGTFLSVEAARPVGIVLTAWWILSIFGFYSMGPRMVLRRMRLHGTEFEITSKRNPRLKAVLSKGSAMLGISEPEGFLTDEAAPRAQLVGRKDPYFFLVTEGAVSLLTPPELDCLTLRLLVHARQGHIARLALIKNLDATPAAIRFLAWPVNFYSTLLQMAWSESADQTADRLTLLLVRDHKLLLRSILKMHSLHDPAMQEAEITPEDIEEYVNQAGKISVHGTEISTQYKLGSAISANVYLEDRLKALSEWARSQEFQDALQKLAEARARSAGPVA